MPIVDGNKRLSERSDFFPHSKFDIRKMKLETERILTKKQNRSRIVILSPLSTRQESRDLLSRLAHTQTDT